MSDRSQYAAAFILGSVLTFFIIYEILIHTGSECLAW